MSDNIKIGIEQSGRNRRRNYRNRPRNKRDFPVCPVCEKSVRFLLTAIAVGEDNKPAHFDCILKKISDTEDLGPKEKVTYIGNGNFAVISGKPGRNLTIKKKIEFESRDFKVEWRKQISRKLKNR